MIFNHDDDDENNRDIQQDNDLQHYLSNGNDQTKKPWDDQDFVDYDMTKYGDDDEENDNKNPLSLNDLIMPKPPTIIDNQTQVF